LLQVSYDRRGFLSSTPGLSRPRYFSAVARWPPTLSPPDTTRRSDHRSAPSGANRARDPLGLVMSGASGPPFREAPLIILFVYLHSPIGEAGYRHDFPPTHPPASGQNPVWTPSHGIEHKSSSTHHHLPDSRGGTMSISIPFRSRDHMRMPPPAISPTQSEPP